MPVDAESLRILIDPTLHLGDCFASVALLAGQEKCLSEPWQVLVPVQLVNEFGVSRAAAVNKVVVRPEAARPAGARHGVSVPVNLAFQTDFAMAEEFNHVRANPLRIVDRLLDPLRTISGDQSHQILTTRVVCR